MIRIDLPWVIGVFRALDGLDVVVADKKIDDVIWQLFGAKEQLESLFNHSVYVPYLRVSKGTAMTLSGAINDLVNIYENKKETEEDTISVFDAWRINNFSSKLETNLLAELSTLPSFLVSPKASYDVSVLIEQGAKLFPETILLKVPEAEADMSEAGKALAFELGTACGFHAFRVVESVLKRYWDEVSKKEKRPKLQTIGNFSKELREKQFGSEKVWATLQQIGKLHRNPLIHPDVILSVDEAIEILGISRSIIGEMLRVLPEERRTKVISEPVSDS